MRRGFYGIGIFNTKTKANIGTLWRTASLFGAGFVFTVGARYQKQASDTMKTYRHIPLFNYKDFQDLKEHLPFDCPLVGIELTPDAQSLNEFEHPERACYLLGAEDHGLPKSVLDECHKVIKLEGDFSMNVAVAGSIVIYHRVNLAR